MGGGGGGGGRACVRGRERERGGLLFKAVKPFKYRNCRTLFVMSKISRYTKRHNYADRG